MQPERFESREWAVSYFGSLRPAWLPVRLLGAVGTIKEAQGEGSVWSCWVDFKKY